METYEARTVQKKARKAFHKAAKEVRIPKRLAETYQQAINREQPYLLEALWYRGLYSYACHLRPGAQAPGLAANIPVSDRTAWHGKYTWNHNVQKWYFPNLPVNHPEWHDVLAELIEEQMPTFRHLAKTIFGLEGVYCDLSGRPRETPSQAIARITS